MRCVRVVSSVATSLAGALSLAGCHAAPPPAPSVAATPHRSWPALDMRPDPLPRVDYKPPEIVERHMANGIRLLIVQQRELPVVHLRLIIKRGAADARPGVAMFAADSFFRRIQFVPGTTARSWVSYDAISVDAVGLTRWANSSNLPEHSFSALAGMLRMDALPEAIFSAGLSDLLERQVDREHDLDGIARLIEIVSLYPETHPYHFDPGGDRRALQALSRQHVEQFFRDHVQPDQVAMVAAGDVATESFVDSMNFSFGSWSGRAAPRRPLPEPIEVGPSGSSIALVDAPRLSESVISVGARGAGWSSPDFLPLVMLNTLLGATFQSRINLSLRERTGYAYTPFSSFSPWRGSGPFLVQGKVDVQDTPAAVTRIAGELARVRDEALDAEALQQLQQLTIRRLPLLFATLADTVEAVSQLAIHDRATTTYETLAESVQQVTAAELTRVARTYLAENKLRWVVVAPAGAVKEPLEHLAFGAVTLVSPAFLSGE